MIDSLERRIREDADKVTSQEIVATIKVASSLAPYLAGAGGLLLGGIGINAINSGNEEAARQDANARALLAGAAGAGLGLYASTLKDKLTADQASAYNSDEELTTSDMQYLFGR